MANTMYCPRGYILLLVIVVLGIIWTSMPTASSASIGKEEMKTTNENQVQSHVKKRDLDKTSKNYPDILPFGKVDSGMMKKLGDMGLVHPERTKRDHNSVEIEKHMLNAEADSIASAEESSAAETHAIAAAVEAAEAEQGIKEDSAAFEENENGEMIRVPDIESHETFHGAGKGHGSMNDMHHAHDISSDFHSIGREHEPASHHRNELDDLIQDISNLHGHEQSYDQHDQQNKVHHMTQDIDNRHGHEPASHHKNDHDDVFQNLGNRHEHEPASEHHNKIDHLIQDLENRQGHEAASHHRNEVDDVSHDTDNRHGHEAASHHRNEVDDIIHGIDNQHGHETASHHRNEVDDINHGIDNQHGHGPASHHRNEVDDTSQHIDNRHGHEPASHHQNGANGMFHESHMENHHGHGPASDEHDQADEVFHVSDTENREGNHEHGSGFEQQPSDLSSYDSDSKELISSEQLNRHVNNHADYVSSDTVSQSGIESSARMDDVETPLNKLLDQSIDLAKETRLVFQAIAKREDYLVNEMESFKLALQKAIEALEETSKENKARYKRWDNGNFDPYKACVYVTPPDSNSGRNVIGPQEKFFQEPPPPPVIEEQPPLPPPPEPEPMPMPNNAPSQMGDDVDLSSVYWLKLPQNEEESSLEKVQRVLGEVRTSGRDVLLIPVLKGFTSTTDIARGFLRSVRVNPADLKVSSNKKMRRRLRLRIRVVK